MADGADADDQSALLETEPMWIDEPGYLIPDDGTAAYDVLGGLPEVDWHPAAPVALDQTATSPLTDCVVWLQRNYRFGLDSDIGRLSVAIRRGSVDDALAALTPGSQDNPTKAALHIDDAGPHLSERTLARLNAGFEPYARTLAETPAGTLEAGTGAAPLFDALNRFRILAATRHGPRGVDEINARVSAWVRAAASVTLGAGAQWFAGRPVIVTRNDYALGVFNGDIGIALPAAERRHAGLLPDGRRNAANALSRRIAAPRHGICADSPQIAGLGIRSCRAGIAERVWPHVVAGTGLYGDHARAQPHRRDRLDGRLRAGRPYTYAA
jgi:hypothetical protein